jgi:mannose-6-phosphate isomerase
VQPIELGPNQPRQFYRGGGAIDQLRGTRSEDGYRPEDWVASATSRFGLGDDGQSRLPDGRLLRDALADDPDSWLGPEHAAYFGASPGLLVKFLEAGQRLPVHVHPSRSFAYRHLGSRHGKTEAWLVLGTTGADASVYLGWSRDVPYAELHRWVDEQDGEAMLANMHQLTVRPGATVLVPAGTAHAIGSGVFCVELQEPSDFSIMLEFKGFDIDPAGGDLGLGRDTALACVTEKAFTPAQVEALQRQHSSFVEAPGTGSPYADHDLFAPAARPYFRAEIMGPERRGPVERSFAVLVGTWGSGRLTGPDWALPVRRGSTIVVPWSAGPVSLEGDVRLVRCLPPTAADAATDDPRGR